MLDIKGQMSHIKIPNQE